MKTANVVANFAQLYEILSGHKGESVFLGVYIADAESYGKAEGVYVHETQGEYPSWHGMSHSVYMITDTGIEEDAQRPYPVSHDGGWFTRYPKIKLTHSETEAQFNLSLGKEWWAKCKAPLVKGRMTEMSVELIRRPNKQVEEIN